MAEKGLPAPTPKAVRAKCPNQTKTKEPPQKNPPAQNPSKTTHPLEPRVAVVPVVPVDQSEDQVPLYPPNQPNQLPDIPPDQPGQSPNNPLNQPNPPTNPPNPTNPPPNLPNQAPNPPSNPPNPMQPQIPPPQVPQLSWSYFKPEFSGKPEEGVVAHLLRTNDWMEAHNFPDGAKVQRFCLTLTGETRLWYETLRPIEIDWMALQECLRQQYSKFGSTREQYFHVWRSDTIDSYISKIKQVAALLNYGEPQILELFKNTLPSKLYWILFPINNLRDAVDATKRVLTKEKLDKHLSGQTVNSTPFMKMGDTSHSGRKMSINAQDSIGEKLENLTPLMYKMSIQQEEGKKPFKCQVYLKRGKGQRRQNFDNRDRSRNNDRQRQNFRRTQNRCGNSNRRGNYRQNCSRNNSRNRGRQNFRGNYSNDTSRSRERSPTPRRYGNR